MKTIIGLFIALCFTGCAIQTQCDYRTYLGAESGVLVFGDSRMWQAQTRWYEIGHRVIDYSQGGSAISGVIDRLQYVDMNQFKFDIIYCQIGINDIGAGFSVINYINDYRKAIQTMKTYTDKIVIGSIIGITSTSAVMIDNNAVTQWNIQLKALCIEQGVTYFDCGFMSDGINGIFDFFQTDGLHFSWNGYSVLMPQIKNIINSL